MSKKLQVIHFHNGTGGGVFSVIKNLVEYSQNTDIENHVIYTTNKEKVPEFEMPEIKGAVSQQVFYYSPKWNFYYTCKQLAKLLPDDKAVIVAHDWLELGMASHLGLQNPVVQFLHGDYYYYYQLAKANSGSVDKYITIAENIKTKLIKQIPDRKEDIYYLRFPVPHGNERVEVPGRCNIIFIGRLTEGKGYHLLPAIASALHGKDLKADWHIVGTDSEGEGLKEKTDWDKHHIVRHYGECSSEEVRALLANMDFIILPSAFEGMPVTLVEAMESGVIPLVNDIDGGIQELVINNETGFKIKENNVSKYAEKLFDLHKNETVAATMRKNCIKRANTLFDPVINTKEIESVFLGILKPGKFKKPVKVYGSRLDKRWIPNRAVTTIRNLGF